MSESGPAGELPPQPNPLAEYVIKNLRPSKYVREDQHPLNGANPEERNANFIKALKNQLYVSGVDPEVTREGGNFTLHRIIGEEDVIAKRLRFEDFTEPVEIESVWEAFQEDHKTALKYFGRRFIPATEFVISGPDHFIIQERAKGELYDVDAEIPPVSPELKTEMIEFIRRYEKMMREEGVILDNITSGNLMIDYATGKITAFDTNDLTSLSRLPNDTSKDFINEFQIDPTTLITSADIINTLIRIFPDELGELEGQDNETILERLDIKKGDLGRRIYSRLSSPVSDGFEDLVYLADTFLPGRRHSKVIKKVMEQFGIDEEDLNPTQEA